MSKTSWVYEHAVRELQKNGMLGSGQPMPGTVTHRLLQLIEVLSEQNHNDHSYKFLLKSFNTLANFLPLTPLLGDDREWNHPVNGLSQNKRAPRVFKDATGQAFDSEAVVFEYEDGHREIDARSVRPITFPYTPTSIIEKVKE